MALSRRFFLGSAAVISTLAGSRANAVALQTDTKKPAVRPPSANQIEMEQGAVNYDDDDRKRYFVDRPGSDFMTDIIKHLDIDYFAINAGSSFRGLHESVVTYGGNRKPELITCHHEEQAVGLAHGYAKATGKPIAVACHGTVGLQHAAMALYNAWCDRAPLLVFAGNHQDSTQRPNFVSWVHSAQDPGAIVRDFMKWDDQPQSLGHFMDSTIRAHRIVRTVPMGPALVVVDAHLQEEAVHADLPAIPPVPPLHHPQGDDGALQAAAELLAQAKLPVIVVDIVARDQRGVEALVSLAEALQAPVVDKRGRMNFPNHHYLNQTPNARQILAEADVILALEVSDIWGTLWALQDQPIPIEMNIASHDVKVITIGMGEVYLKSNYQDFQRFFSAHLPIAGDAQTSLLPLRSHIRRALGRLRSDGLAHRARRWRDAAARLRQKSLADCRRAWNASPITTARLSAELWELLKGRDWVFASQGYSQSGWPHRLWDFTQYHQYMGGPGGAGLGYGGPAAVGIALANRPHGRLVVNIQGDGDFMVGPGMLWTAAHHQIPLLTIVHNNGGYHQEVMHLQRMALQRERGAEGNAYIGNRFGSPEIQYAAIAKGLGVWAEGPVSQPQELRDSLRRAIAVVERGEPALIDVVCQPR